MKQLIIAVDFDGILVSDKFPQIGVPDTELIDELKLARKLGHKIILLTSREDVMRKVGTEQIEWHMLGNAIEFCRDHGLEFDAVNENITPDWNGWVADKTRRKIGADLFLDDKCPCWNRDSALRVLTNMVRGVI